MHQKVFVPWQPSKLLFDPQKEPIRMELDYANKIYARIAVRNVDTLIWGLIDASLNRD